MVRVKLLDSFLATIPKYTHPTRGWFCFSLLFAGRLHLPYPSHLTWQVITDHAQAAAIFSSITRSVVSQKAVLESGIREAEVLRECRWLLGTFTIRLALEEEIKPDEQLLRFYLIESPLFHKFEGFWRVKTADDQQTRQCTVEHELWAKAAVPLPPPLSWFVRSMFESEVTKVLQELEEEVARRDMHEDWIE
jgi:hypothetical protein